MAGRKVRGAEDARACMMAVAQSGMTRRDWAVAHGVDARSLHLWDVRLRPNSVPTPRPMPALAVPRPVRFVELVAEAAPECGQRSETAADRRVARQNAIADGEAVFRTPCFHSKQAVIRSSSRVPSDASWR